MHATRRISPCLWFDDQAEQAVAFYTSVFRNSKVIEVARYGEAGREVHGKPAGTVMTVAFELDGQTFTALNGGPMFKFNEAVSLAVHCDTQDEVDHYWDRLSSGGDPKAQQCGWLKDRFGASWQVLPRALVDWMTHNDPEVVKRVTAAMLQMKKFDIAQMQEAAQG